MESDFIHSLNKFSEIQLAREILIHAAEAFTEPFKLLDNLKVSMLN
jgi:hypothetical protein